MKRLRTGSVACPRGWSLLLCCSLSLFCWIAPTQPVSAAAPTYLIYTTAHELWTVPVGGGKPIMIARGLARPVVRMSPDRRYLLYAFPSSLIVAGVTAAMGWRQLFVSRVNGSHIQVVATLSASSYGAQFAWSSDDSHLLYVRVHVTGPPPNKAGAAPTWPWELRAVNVASRVTIVAWTGQLNRFAPVPLAWRRDLGIVYATDSVAGGLSTRYAQIDVATQTATVTPLQAIPTTHITPSPLQHYVAIASHLAGQNNALLGLYAVGAIGSAVTSATLSHQTIVGPLAWSRAGGDLAYTTRTASIKQAVPGQVQVHVFSLMLGRDRIVGTARSGATVVSWSPDGKLLLIRDPTASPPSLYLVPATGGGARQSVEVATPLSAVVAGFAGWGISA